jgi:protein-S-isoprenylcysteine O-methyltransferase Ste14
LQSLISVVVAMVGAGLVLVGWGIDDLSGFTDELARPIGLVVAAVGSALAVPGIRFRVEMKSEAAGQEWLAVLNMAAFGVGLWLLPFLDARPDVASFLHVSGDGVRWVGLVLFAGGEGLSVWAIHTLGRWFSPRIGVQHGHELVSAGPYRALRHPFYTGLLMATVGLPAIFGSWLGIAMAIVALPLVIYRIGVEEDQLEREFGDGYHKMRTRTWRLIPYVY